MGVAMGGANHNQIKLRRAGEDGTGTISSKIIFNFVVQCTLTYHVYLILYILVYFKHCILDPIIMMYYGQFTLDDPDVH